MLLAQYLTLGNMYKKLAWHIMLVARSGNHLVLLSQHRRKKPPPHPNSWGCGMPQTHCCWSPLLCIPGEPRVALHRSLLDHKNLSGITKLQHNLPYFQTLNFNSFVTYLCRQLILLLELYSPRDVYDYLRPIALNLCADKVSSVRWISYKLVCLSSLAFPSLLSSHRTDGSQPYLILPLGQWNGEETPHSNTPNIWSRPHKWAGREFWQVSEVVWSASLCLCLPGKKGLGTGSQTPRSPCSSWTSSLNHKTELTVWPPIMRCMLLKVRHLSGSSSQLAYPHHHNSIHITVHTRIQVGNKGIDLPSSVSVI